MEELIYWTEQRTHFGLNHPTRTGTYEDFKFDIRYDYDGDPLVKPDENSCKASLIIYFMGAKIYRSGGSVDECTIHAKNFLREFAKKYSILFIPAG